MNLLLILTGAAVVIVPLLAWPRTAAHLLIATADAAAAFRGSWKRRGQIKAVPAKAAAPALDQVQIDTVSALKNYGMARPDAEALVRLVGTASDVPALLAKALQSRGRRAA